MKCVPKTHIIIFTFIHTFYFSLSRSLNIFTILSECPFYTNIWILYRLECSSFILLLTRLPSPIRCRCKNFIIKYLNREFLCCCCYFFFYCLSHRSLIFPRFFFSVVVVIYQMLWWNFSPALWFIIKLPYWWEMLLILLSEFQYKISNDFLSDSIFFPFLSIDEQHNFPSFRLIAVSNLCKQCCTFSKRWKEKA